MREHDPVPTLARLLAVLDADAEVDIGERELRDTQIGRELDPQASPSERVGLWLRRMSPTTERGLEVPIAAAGSLSVTIGVLLGMLSAAALFFYDGRARVNALAVLGFLVGAPSILLLFSWLSCLSITRARVWPLVGGVLGTVAHLSPGRLTGLLTQRLSRGGLEHLRLLAPRAGADTTIATVRMWFYARWSHLVGVGYFSGALLTMLTLIVFSDLVFGWSTTLEVQAAQLRSLTSTMALPWSWAWPAADPSLELIHNSQYFRAAAAVEDVTALAALGRWWPFLLMSVLVYGWLPRVVSAALCARALDRAALRAMIEHAASLALLERLRTPMVTPSLVAGNEHSEPSYADLALPAASVQASAVGLLINWANVGLADAVVQTRFAAPKLVHAGGTRSIAEDDAVISSAEPGVTCVVVCKAWEPPLLELHDFVNDLHRQSGAQVVVIPVTVVAGQPGPAAPRDREIWHRSFAALPADSGIELDFDTLSPASISLSPSTPQPRSSEVTGT